MNRDDYNTTSAADRHIE